MIVLPDTTARAELAPCGRELNQSLSGNGRPPSERRAERARIAERFFLRPGVLDLGKVLFGKAFSGCESIPGVRALSRSTNPRPLPKLPQPATHSHETEGRAHRVGGRFGRRDHIRSASFWGRWWRVIHGTHFALGNG